MKIKIYAGLSLREEDALRILPEADFAPPAGKGDLTRDIRQGYHVVAIIDGVFHQSPAVSCGEIMDALRAGVRVYGSSSMGALRASELDRYGMIGHGKIYEHIKATDCFPDDYLGQLYSEGRSDARRTSIPYIDFHFALAELASRGRATRSECDTLASAYRRLHYTQRNPDALRASLPPSSKRLKDLAQAVFAVKSQKKEDALGLLKAIRGDLKAVQRLNRALNVKKRKRSPKQK